LRSREDLFENIHYIPNAVDFDHFAQAQKVQLEVPQELRKIPGIKIGFVGRINELLDLNLMSALAAHDRKWTIILIGSVNAKRRYRKSKDFLKIKSMPNVYFMGHRPYEQLPAFLKGIDVCVLPFRKSTWMESSCPNKIFQYLAAGKPIVSTNFPASAELNNVIEVSGEISDFIKKIEICLLEENEQKRKIRIEVARKFSVSRHADLIIYEIEKSLSKN
jgi:glycosyltransferase involved in cell wall biosynthesis